MREISSAALSPPIQPREASTVAAGIIAAARSRTVAVPRRAFRFRARASAHRRSAMSRDRYTAIALVRVVARSQTAANAPELCAANHTAAPIFGLKYGGSVH